MSRGLHRRCRGAYLPGAFAFFLFVLGGVLPVHGQQDKIRGAFSAYQNGDMDVARKLIDEAAEDPSTGEDGNTWYLRGFIYSELYSQREFSNPQSELRKRAEEFFVKAMAMNLDEKRRQNSKAKLKYLATTHYNDVVRTLTADHYKTAILNFERYAQLIRVADSTADVRSSRIEFLLALASLYTRIYDSDPENKKDFWLKARDTFKEILTMDEKNLQANYNMGILYYNKAVYIINGADYDQDFVAINQIQDTCVVLFRQSLPYMQTAYELQPDNINTLTGLSGIYFGLNEIEKSNELQKQIQTLRGQNK